MKDIKYNSQLYLTNLSKINGASNNDKNKYVDNLTLPFRIILNKLKFIECLINKYNQERLDRTGKNNVIMAVIPTLG